MGLLVIFEGRSRPEVGLEAIGTEGRMTINDSRPWNDNDPSTAISEIVIEVQRRAWSDEQCKGEARLRSRQIGHRSHRHSMQTPLAPVLTVSSPIHET